MAAAGCSSRSPSSDPGACIRSGAEALKVCSGSATVSGIDVSNYQGSIDWVSVKASGQAFAFARVSDGLNYPDARFAANWPAMKAAGVLRGTYQYFRPGQDPSLQAKLFIDKINAAGGMAPGDLPPVLDVETADGQAAAVVQANAQVWLATVSAAFGITPLVYTAAFMSPTIGTALSGYPLWVANYGVTCPTMPSGWSVWSFWQSSSTGKIPGISGNVDTDVFDGTLAQLHALTLADAPADAGAGDAGGSGAGDAGGYLPHAGPDLDPRATPASGSDGATLGSSTPAAPPSSPDPCALTGG